MAIVIVDDSRSMRHMIRSVLEADGRVVREADNGAAALALLRDHAAELVITDVNMPAMDGLTLTTEIRKLEQHRFVPILILTTEAGEDMKQRGRAAGATGWLVKPFNPVQLRQVIERLLGTPTTV
jgi:two-component system chemotaxis response regulator CheY